MLYGVHMTRTVFFFIFAAKGEEQRAWTPPLAHCQVCIFSRLCRPFCLWGGFLQTWCQSFFRVTRGLCLLVARVPAAEILHRQAEPSKPRHLTPVCVCLLTPLLNIYTHIQTVSQNELHQSPMFCISPLCFALGCSPTDRKRPKNIHRNQSEQTKQRYTGRVQSKQHLASPDDSLISTGCKWDVTPCLANMLSLSLATEQQTTPCWTSLSFVFCFSKQRWRVKNLEHQM